MAKKKTKGVSLVGLIFAIVVLAATIISGVSFCLDLFKIDVNIKQLETIIKIQDLGFDRGEEIFFLVSWIIGLVGLFVALVGEAGKVFKKNVNYWSVRLWNSALAVLTCGSLLHGIIAVSGRSSEYDWCYYAMGAAFAVSAVINYVRSELQAGKPFYR